jgi:release factor glutamine methyltransferase
MSQTEHTQCSIFKLLRNARQQLSTSAAASEAGLDAEILLGHALNKNRTFLRTWPEKILSDEQRAGFQALLMRRLQGEPIAYILGERDFWDMTLRVSPDTLIPRPETETLVEQALFKIPADVAWNIADLGTGSGAIALAIARERPLCQILATDLSAPALLIAKDNARRLGVNNIRFAEGAWLTPLSNQRFEIIVSNPPYIHPDDPHLQRGDLRFEPRSALQSAQAGMADIQQICLNAPQHLSRGGWLLLEHGFEQGKEVRDCLQSHQYQRIGTVEDLAHNPRISFGSQPA